MCDLPAGASIAFELYALPNGKPYNTTPFFEVQAGTTDACLGTNPGQLRPSAMSALASSLSSASPQLFTGYTSTSAATSTGRDGVSSTSTTASAPFATHTPAASDSARSESYLDKGAVIGGVLGGLVALVLALVALWWLRRRRTRRRKSDACTTESSHAASTYNPSRPRPPPSSMSISPPGATVSSWLGRSRPRSQRDAFGASGSRASVDGSNEAPADVPRWSQGPRADLPEVGEVGDFRAYHVGGGGPPAPLGRGAQLADASLAPRNGGVHSPTEEDLPLPSTLRPRAGRNGADGVALSSPPQLPATMTTPGALTTYGDEDRGGAAPERAGYASRPAGSGRRA